MKIANQNGSGPSTPSTGLGRRRFLGLSAAAVAGAGLAACGKLGSADESGSTKKVGFALATFTVPRYVKLDLPNFKKAAKGAGFSTISTQADSDVDKQLEQVTNLLSQDIAALAFMPVDSKAGVALVRKAKSLNVPVLVYNQAVPSPDVTAFVSRDGREAGRDMVEGARTALGELKGNIIICSGQAGDQIAIDITEGYMDALKDDLASGAVKIVSQRYHAGWDPESARKQVEDSLTSTNNDVIAVLSNNDGMAGGAIQALQAQGLDKKVVVTGLDATSEACRAIVLGQQNLSIFTPFDKMGQMAGELTAKLAEGKKLNAPATYNAGGTKIPWFPMASEVITIDNLVEYVKKYSPAYVDAKVIFNGIPASDLPDGASDLL